MQIDPRARQGTTKYYRLPQNPRSLMVFLEASHIVTITNQGPGPTPSRPITRSPLGQSFNAAMSVIACRMFSRAAPSLARRNRSTPAKASLTFAVYSLLTSFVHTVLPD